MLSPQFIFTKRKWLRPKEEMEEVGVGVWGTKHGGKIQNGLFDNSESEPHSPLMLHFNADLVTYGEL